MIRKQTISELYIIEERKKARNEQKDFDRQKKEKKELEIEQIEAQAAAGMSMTNKSGLFGMTGGRGGVSFAERS